MNIIKNTFILAATLAVLLTSTMLFAGLLDKDVSLSSLPPKVQEAIKQHAEGGTIKSIEEESSKKDGLKVYEVEVKNSAGKEIEFKVDENGKLLELERD